MAFNGLGMAAEADRKMREKSTKSSAVLTIITNVSFWRGENDGLSMRDDGSGKQGRPLQLWKAIYTVDYAHDVEHVAFTVCSPLQYLLPPDLTNAFSQICRFNSHV